jgi:hypothetical protein
MLAIVELIKIQISIVSDWRDEIKYSRSCYSPIEESNLVITITVIGIRIINFRRRP